MQTIPRINIIGAGRVGQTLAHLLHKKELVIIQDVYCRSDNAAQKACQFIGGGNPITAISQVKPADIHLITVPDSYIQAACEELAQAVDLSNAIVIHCSGALTAGEVLAAAQSQGASIASAHPVLSFAAPAQAIHHFQGVFCSIEGTQPAISTLTTLFYQLKAVPFELSSDNKPLYHAACVLSNNYAYALAHLAIQSFQHAGMNSDFAQQASVQLIQSALNNLQKLSPKQALTGPIARADTNTIQKHQHAIAAAEQNDNDNDIAKLYQLLGEYCVKHLTEHSEQQQQQLIDSLKEIKV